MTGSIRARLVRRLKWLWRPGSSPDEDDLSAVYRTLFGRCPLCGESVGGHAHWKMASAVLARPSGAAGDLARLVAERKWREAAAVTQWAHDADVREYHVVRCPNAGRLGLVTAVFTHEFWSGDFVEDARALAEEDESQISQLASDRWRAL